MEREKGGNVSIIIIIIIIIIGKYVAANFTALGIQEAFPSNIHTYSSACGIELAKGLST